MDANSPPYFAAQEVDKIVGPQILTVLLNSGLLGVLSVQVYLYYLAFPNDRSYMKCLVYGIYFLEFVQSVFIVEAGFQTFVNGFGDLEVLDQIKTQWLSIPVLTAIDTFFVQGFYAYRISILGRSKAVAGAIIALSCVQLGGGIAVGIHVEQKKYYSLVKTSKTLSLEGSSLVIWLIGSVLCDIIIAICMIYYLSRCDSSIKQTKMILKKIIRLTIETGSLTAVAGIACFLLAVLPATPFCYEFPMGAIGKLYASSMLVLINSRIILGSEEPRPTIISGMKFGMAPDDANAIEPHSGGSSVLSRKERVGSSGSLDLDSMRKLDL